MKLKAHREFLKDYKSLPPNVQKQLNYKLKLLSEDPSHPSLRSERLRGSPGICASSINMQYRFTWEYSGYDVIVLRRCGDHDVLDKP